MMRYCSKKRNPFLIYRASCRCSKYTNLNNNKLPIGIYFVNPMPNNILMKPVTIKSIFIVDDDPFWAQMLEQILHNNGYPDVRIFGNGTDCLDNLHLAPDLILLDYSMNTLSGLEVLRKIKRFNPDMSVVFVSAQEDIEVAVSSLKYGAFDYIVKSDTGITRLPKVIERLKEVKLLLARQKKGKIKQFFSFI